MDDLRHTMTIRVVCILFWFFQSAWVDSHLLFSAQICSYFVIIYSIYHAIGPFMNTTFVCMFSFLFCFYLLKGTLILYLLFIIYLCLLQSNFSTMTNTWCCMTVFRRKTKSSSATTKNARTTNTAHGCGNKYTNTSCRSSWGHRTIHVSRPSKTQRYKKQTLFFVFILKCFAAFFRPIF